MMIYPDRLGTNAYVSMHQNTHPKKRKKRAF
eukprot:COSAG06_NODE_16913_length_973_cov_1.556064_1_plen_30_part_10